MTPHKPCIAAGGPFGADAQLLMAVGVCLGLIRKYGLDEQLAGNPADQALLRDARKVARSIFGGPQFEGMPRPGGMFARVVAGLEAARAALPDAWATERCGVPQELIAQIDALIDEATGRTPCAGPETSRRGEPESSLTETLYLEDGREVRFIADPRMEGAYAQVDGEMVGRIFRLRGAPTWFLSMNGLLVSSGIPSLTAARVRLAQNLLQWGA